MVKREYSSLYEKIFCQKSKGLFVLIDPDKKLDLEKLLKEVEKFEFVKGIFVGSSFLYDNLDFDEFILKLKNVTKLPVIIFPGGVYQISKEADGILFLSLLSGRNPQFLIGEQVRMAPFIKKFNLEAIPTAYLLIDGGKFTSVEYVSQTKPLPRDKIDLILAHALAAKYLGMKVIYLEAGSGAKEHVPFNVIKKVKEEVNLPLIVGGGLKLAEDIIGVWKAGGDFVVVGTAFEKNLINLKEVEKKWRKLKL